jgi:D-aspartate ligase
VRPVDTTTPVVVLRFHHGSLAIARTLGRWGVDVFGVDADPKNPSLRSRYVRDRFIWDFDAATDADSIDFLVDLAGRIGRRAVLIPTSDRLAELVADHADALEPHFLFPRVEPDLVRALSNKKDLYHLARRLDIPTPETVFPADRAAVETFARQARFPVMLKAADGLKMEARTGVKMVIVESAEEMLRQYDRLEDPDEPNLMIQEYIPGDDDTIWMFEGYFDRDSECVAGFTGRKLRQHPVHRGATSLGVLIGNAEVDATTRRFMKEIGYRGVLDIGYRFDARDGSYKLLDPNPRIGSTFRLFVGTDDTDVARLLYLDMTGQPLPSTRPAWGRRWVIEDQDLFSSLDYAREGTLSFGSWLRSFRRVEETAWFARDDLRPFVLTAAGVARYIGGALRRRLTGRRNPSARPSTDAPAPADRREPGQVKTPRRHRAAL